MKNYLIKCILIIFALSSLALMMTASSIYLYEKREQIADKLGFADKESMQSADDYWAREILNGGYILHFRHAERDKWIDVQMYDVLESDLHINGVDSMALCDRFRCANHRFHYIII